MERDVKNTIGAIDRASEFRATIRIHTSLMPWLLLILFGTTLMQSLDVWKGDMWRFHHDFVSPDTHQWAIELSETLGHEHLLVGYHKENPQLEESHPHHHSNIEKIVSSHWQNDILTWVLHLNMVLVLTWLLRFYFYLKRQTHLSMVSIMWILLVSTILQVVALAMRVWVFVTYITFWSTIGLLTNGLLLLIELASLQDIYEIRRITMFLAMKMRNVKVSSEELNEVPVGGRMSEDNSNTSTSDKQTSKATISSPIAWTDSITTFLVNLGDNISIYREQQRKHQKYD